MAQLLDRDDHLFQSSQRRAHHPQQDRAAAEEASRSGRHSAQDDVTERHSSRRMPHPGIQQLWPGKMYPGKIRIARFSLSKKSAHVNKRNNLHQDLNN